MHVLLLEMLGHFFHWHVPAAIVTGWHGRIAFLAIKRTAVQELIDPLFLDGAQSVGIHRERHRRFALLAGAMVVVFEGWSIVFVNAAGHDTATDA